MRIMISAMTDLTALLEESVNKFWITTKNGVSFWAPYLRNDMFLQSTAIPHGLGKSYPVDIENAANYVVAEDPTADEQTIRQRLTDGSLAIPESNYKGIDCSGFAYIVYEEFFARLLDTRLSNYLFVPKDQVLNGAMNYTDWQNAYMLSELEAEALPDHVPLTWVVDTFKRKPINLCNVNAFVLDETSTEVLVNEVKVGDLLHLKTFDDDRNHIAVVIDRETDRAQIAHSTRFDQNDIGGVVTEWLPITESKLETSKMSNPHKLISARRFKALEQI
jgi:hypothetical protein